MFPKVSKNLGALYINYHLYTNIHNLTWFIVFPDTISLFTILSFFVSIKAPKGQKKEGRKEGKKDIYIYIYII